MIFTPAGGIIFFSIFAVLTIGTLIYSIIRRPKHGAVNKLSIVVRTIAVIMLVFAVARPSIPSYSEIERLGSNLDIYFVLDTTASMGAEDVSGESRLDYAKSQITQIAADNVGAKYSLITFDSIAKTEIPLIRDLSALKSTISMVQPQTYVPSLSKGSNTMLPAELLTKSLNAGKEQNPERLRIVYYITDGEDTDYQKENNHSLIEAGKLADESYVIGVGSTSGSQIPRYVFDNSYEVVQDGYYSGNSAMNPEQINKIAEELGASTVTVDDNKTPFPPVKAEAKESKLTLVDKRSPAQIEFYWMLAIGAVVMFGLDLFFLTRKTYEATRGR